MTFRVALKALNRNKMRTALTMLGMIIGVGAVIAMVALGNGRADRRSKPQIQSAGTNIINVNCRQLHAGWRAAGLRWRRTRSPSRCTAIRDEVPGVQYLCRGREHARAGHRRQPELADAHPGHATSTAADPVVADEYGAFFTAQDVQTARQGRRCSAPSSATNLFGEDVDPTGQVIRIKNQPFKVIGVHGQQGPSAMGRGSGRQSSIAPYTTVQKKLMGITYIQNITVSAASADDIVKATADAITTLLRARHKILPGDTDDFMVRTLEEMAAMRTETTRTMTALLAGIAGVSLLVGGIGIMNIMLVSVTERTREIGLRMAIGARGGDVLLQFLVEAVVLSLFGGIDRHRARVRHLAEA